MQFSLRSKGASPARHERNPKVTPHLYKRLRAEIDELRAEKAAMLAALKLAADWIDYQRKNVELGPWGRDAALAVHAAIAKAEK